MNVLQLDRVYVLPSVGMSVKRCAECMDSERRWYLLYENCLKVLTINWLPFAAVAKKFDLFVKNNAESKRTAATATTTTSTKIHTQRERQRNKNNARIGTNMTFGLWFSNSMHFVLLFAVAVTAEALNMCQMHAEYNWFSISISQMDKWKLYKFFSCDSH